MKVTIKDIAERCETSSATVSRVLSGSDYPVSKQLRNRIVSTAYEMNYRPNIFGRLLRGSKSREVGVIVPGIANPYYGELLESVEKACFELDLKPIIRSSYNSPELEQQHIDDCVQNQVCGILISSIREVQEYKHRSENDPIPFIYFDQSLCGETRHYSRVAYDFQQAGFLAASYLLQTGHKNIAYVTPSFDRPSRKLICRGIRQATEALSDPVGTLKTYTLAENEAYSRDMMLSYMHIREIARKLAVDIIRDREEPDALIVMNDLLAIALMKELAKEGIRIPRDLSIVSHDDTWLAEVVNPGLTTVRQPAAETGRCAVALLNRHLAEEKMLEPIIIQPELIIRDSVVDRLNVSV